MCTLKTNSHQPLSNSCFLFQQVRAAFEILALLFAFFYIIILIREVIFQEGFKPVFFGLVRLVNSRESVSFDYKWYTVLQPCACS